MPSWRNPASPRCASICWMPVSVQFRKFLTANRLTNLVERHHKPGASPACWRPGSNWSVPGARPGKKRRISVMSMQPDAERQRLKNQQYQAENWRLWGPYLSERAWGTVREDYSGGGSAWEYFDHDQARLRAYRWSE